MAPNTQSKSQKLLKNPHLIKRQGKRSYREDQEIKQLEQWIADGAPAKGTNPLHAAQNNDNGSEQPGPSQRSYAGARIFEELPLSQYTKDGLKRSKYITLTAVQRATLPHALAGRDVLGAAKTGSGKTLSFLIPVVEKLYRLKWTPLDGLGGLVLTPTRELAVQIFEELQKVGHFHDLSAGLLIGGKNVKDEAARVGRMAILVATPGRLLQHMDETPGFDASSLQVLVLDEADRILDMGFSATLDAIIDNLPQQRQTMLFSATQTKSVRDLARLSLADPEYLAVHAESANPTPLKLQQAYMVVDLPQKMDVLWSFVRTHLKAKTIVFLSTCKQVRFLFEAFRKLRPGVPLRCLHGGMKQPKRTGVFYDFCEAKDGMVLLATDIAARGLDFPTVDWVVQADCPEDAATYIHRVGRTARYMAAGRALLLLLPSERDGMLAQLGAAKVPLTQIKPNPAKQQAVSPALQALLSKDQQLKDFAQKALTAYLRSVFLQPNKEVFDVAALPAEDFALSLGLLTVPKLRFLKKVRGKQQVVVELGGKAALQEDAEEEEGGAGTGGDEGDADAEGASGSDREGAEEEEEEEERGAAGAGASTSGRPPVGAKRTLAKASAGGAKRLKTAAGAGGGGGGKKDDGDDDDDDDFLVVKKRNVFEAEAAADVDVDDAMGAGEGMDGAAGGADGKKKRKKQKIKVGSGSGSRVVFDEEGQAMDPLELLAAGHMGSDDGGDDGGDGDGAAGQGRGRRDDGDGVYVVSERPEDRFRLAAGLMRQRDREDKRRLKDLKRELKLERKARQRAAAAAEAAGEAGGAGGGVRFTLRGGGGRDDEDDGHDHDEHERKHSYGGSGSEEEEGGSGSSGDDDSEGGPRPRRSAGNGDAHRARVEAAHQGMARKSAGSAAAAAGGGKARRDGATAGMSVAEQEALALQLLAGGRG